MSKAMTKSVVRKRSTALAHKPKILDIWLPTKKGEDRVGRWGRYLPHQGGSLGWFEGKGVPKTELANNYQFHNVFDPSEIRPKLFERWGKDLDRRSEPRKNTAPRYRVDVIEKSTTYKGEIVDISPHGMRVQFPKAAALKKGDTMKVLVFGDPKRKEPTLKLDTLVVWSGTSNINGRSVSRAGFGFMTLNAKEESALKKLSRE
ncbi:MAG: PilZ domain-containing protein [Deltaproteobacteria bacterium]|nr:PilZ domain-containing protein [Deltaproteobacteria bacterium]